MRVFPLWVAILILSFIFSPSLNAQILKWVDKNGTTHYGDQPSGVKDYEYVGESDLITYSKQSPKKRKNKKYRRMASPSSASSSNTGQPQQQYRNEGSSSSQSPARGTSTSRY